MASGKASVEARPIDRATIELIARKEADRGRNQALGILGAIALVLGIAGYLGLDRAVADALAAEPGKRIVSDLQSYVNEQVPGKVRDYLSDDLVVDSVALERMTRTATLRFIEGSVPTKGGQRELVRGYFLPTGSGQPAVVAMGAIWGSPVASVNAIRETREETKGLAIAVRWAEEPTSDSFLEVVVIQPGLQDHESPPEAYE